MKAKTITKKKTKSSSTKKLAAKKTATKKSAVKKLAVKKKITKKSSSRKSQVKKVNSNYYTRTQYNKKPTIVEESEQKRKNSLFRPDAIGHRPRVIFRICFRMCSDYLPPCFLLVSFICPLETSPNPP